MSSSNEKTPPQSCDTFVVMGSHTKTNEIIFGKNSDRPRGEIQECVFYPSVYYDNTPGRKLKCTYIEIDQIMGKSTNATIQSKPNWMFGCKFFSKNVDR